MKVVETVNNDEENYGQYAGVTIKVNDKTRFSISGGEPIMTDWQYDKREDELRQLRPDDPFLERVGY